MIEHDETVEESIRPKVISRRDPEVRKKLHKLIISECNAIQIADAFGITKNQVPALIKAYGFVRIWAENKEARKYKRVPRVKINRHRWKATQPILDEFEKRGFEVTRSTRYIADDCLIEGMAIAVFYPKRSRIPAKGAKPYYIIRSKYLNRFLIVVMPSGKLKFYFPLGDKRKMLYIPEWENDAEEIWPKKMDFRRWKSMQAAQRGVQRKKKKGSTDLSEADIWRLLGFEEDEIPE